MTQSARRRDNLHRALLLSFLCSPPGCSYAFVHGPPAPGEIAPGEAPPGEGQQSPSTRPACTTSNAWPVVDTILGVSLAGLGGLLIVGGAVEGSCSGDFCFGPTAGEAIAIGAAATAVGALLLASAVSGYGRTADCRRAEETLPGGPHPSARHLLDVSGIAAARTRAEQAGQ
jgi:hypothetical protein